ncbi:MAG: nodulation protein NfeD [Gallionella sp.]
MHLWSVNAAARRFFFRVALLLSLPFSAAAGTVVVAGIDGAISPPSATYFLRALEQAKESQAELLVLKLNTPGGLDTSMREMIQAILASPVPVATYVSPSGARAASAGTYLLYASHIAAMTPGTNLGAATPVSIGMGGEQPDRKDDGKGRAPGGTTMEKKVTQDAAAYLRSLAQLRHRNVEWAEKAVREAASLSAEDALKLKVVDFVATDLADLLRQADGRSVGMEGGKRRLNLAGAAIVTVERNWQERLLEAVADPNIALILMMLGVYGLLFEFYNPGIGVAGIVGVISLLLAMYALAMLPINAVGVLLLIAGISMMAAEAFFPSFGVLGIGGAVAFVVGALMLIDADVPGLQVSLALVLPLAITSALVLAGIGSFALRARRRPVVSGAEAMLGGTAEALEDFEGSGWVLAAGERWQARSDTAMKRGERARIAAVDGLILVVQPDGHGNFAAPDNETCHARPPLSGSLPQAGERDKVSLREFHVKQKGEGL